MRTANRHPPPDGLARPGRRDTDQRERPAERGRERAAPEVDQPSGLSAAAAAVSRSTRSGTAPGHRRCPRPTPTTPEAPRHGRSPGRPPPTAPADRPPAARTPPPHATTPSPRPAARTVRPLRPVGARHLGPADPTADRATAARTTPPTLPRRRRRTIQQQPIPATRSPPRPQAQRRSGDLRPHHSEPDPARPDTMPARRDDLRREHPKVRLTRRPPLQRRRRG